MQISTPDDDSAAIAALHERFGIDATIAEGAVTFGVADGEQFVPRLFAELGPTDPLGYPSPVPRSTTCSCPTPAPRSATPRRALLTSMRNVARMMAR